MSDHKKHYEWTVLWFVDKKRVNVLCKSKLVELYVTHMNEKHRNIIEILSRQKKQQNCKDKNFKSDQIIFKYFFVIIQNDS